MSALRRRPWRWAVGAAAAVAVVALVVLVALPKGGALAFRLTGPIEVTWQEFERTGGNVTVTLCNTSSAEVTGIEAEVQGIEFTRAGSTTPSPGVIVTYPRQLAAGKCTEIGLKRAPELAPNAYRGALVVKGPGGGAIRRDFLLAGPRPQDP